MESVQEQGHRTRLGLVASILRKKTAKAGVAIVVFFLVLSLVGPYISPYSPYNTNADSNVGPTNSHLLGTDYIGHDVLAQLLWGAFPSIFIAVLASIGALVLGMIAGLLGGYFRSLNGVTTGISDIVMTFPGIPLMVLIGSMFYATNSLILLLLILVSWAPISRAIRSQVFSIKERPFVESAKIGGMSDWYIVWKIIIPEIVPIAIAYFVLTAASAVVIVAALEFLGVGNPSLPSWGSMLYWAQQYAFFYGDWWWILAPGLCISLLATGFVLIGFSIEEIANPRLHI